MIEVLFAYVVGLVAGLAVVATCRGVIGAYVFQRQNYRDHPLPTSAGVFVALAAILVVGAHVVVIELVRIVSGPSFRGWEQLSSTGPAMVGVVIGFCFLGLLDDLGGVGESGGIRGHLAALFHGRVTTGLIKLVGGPLVALVAVAAAGAGPDEVGVLRDAALIAAAANLANLLDRAPGRVGKVVQLCFVVLVAAAWDTRLVSTAVVAGASLALLLPDLREELMIGDAGSNLMGAALGFGVVLSVGAPARWWVLLALVVANLVSELVSFSRVIDAVPVLRALDRAGSPYRE